MVSKKYVFIFAFFAVFMALFATNSLAQTATFSASLDRNNIAVGDKFEVKFTLKNAEAFSSPNIAKLPENFEVISQSQQQNMAIMNGVSNKTRSWIYKIESSAAGTFQIPKISIQTNIGKLFSNPMNIEISPTSELPNITLDKEVIIEAKVDKLTPYIEEPIIYQTRVYHSGEIESAELVKPSSESAVIEQITEPKTGIKKLEGVEYNTIEVNYLVTPVKSGEITLKPSILRGEIYKEDEKAEPSAGFDNFFDPFALLNGNKDANKKLVPFTVASNDIELEVKPANSEVSPWLALYDLSVDVKITGISKENGNFMASLGEPINFNVSFSAIGKSGDLLPDIEKYITSSDFKIYPDKPNSKRQTLASGQTFAQRIKGTKSQSFTLIPQKSGKLKLPEIIVKYWNLKTAKATEAKFPMQKIFVTKSGNKNSVESIDKPSNNPSLSSPDSLQDTKASKAEGNRMSRYISVIIGILVFLVLALVIKLLNMKKQIEEAKHKGSKLKSQQTYTVKDSNKAEVKKTSKKPRPKEKITNDLSAIASDEDGSFSSLVKKPEAHTYATSIKNAEAATDLLKILQDFAYRMLNMPQNSAGVIIAQNIARNYNIKNYELVKIASEIDGAIYFDKQINLAELKQKLTDSFELVQQKISETSKKPKTSLPPLNPN